ncbi:MAG: hypothetical protein JSS49_00025 [Planctomycetes bacterium]|nr:hypothetical protein [Planctomycetota bacterium]
MREFFKGWRRKLGCVTLLMACMVVAAWLRSGIRYDFFDLNIAGMTYRLGLHGGNLRFIKQGPSASKQLVSWNTGELQELLPYQPGQSRDPWDGIAVDWRWDWNEFHAGAGQYPGGRLSHTCFIIPYWSLTVPLTLLSASLLLWKPRKRTGQGHA